MFFNCGHRKPVRAVLGALALAGALAAPAQGDLGSIFMGAGLSIPPVPREFRAAWIATVSNIDWPTSRTLTPTAQRSEVIAILNAMETARMNAVFVQVRPQCDALYPSTLEPWSPYLTNSMGTAPNPLYDPLEFWITEGHRRGIEVHAWFNPYRALVNKTAVTNGKHVRDTKPHIVVPYDTYSWLNPGHPETPVYTRQVIMDVVNRYDLDGVVFDDYFYPYPVTNVAFPDSTQYALYGGGLSLGDWRRKNVDDFVRDTYNAVKAAKPWVKYGIGPFGIWKPGFPSGITGLNAYESLYADSRKWLQMGWVDYLTPQLYWKTTSTGQNYGRLLSWWVDPVQNPYQRHVWPSNFTSQIISGTWPVSEIQDQIDVTRATPGAGGNVHFSAKGFKNDSSGLRTTLANNQYSTPALVPNSPWLDNLPPLSPLVTYGLNRSPALHTISWTEQGSEPARRIVLATLMGTSWNFQYYSPQTTSSVTVPLKNSGLALRAFAVATVDRMGNLSPWTARVLDSTALGTRTLRDRLPGDWAGPVAKP